MEHLNEELKARIDQEPPHVYEAVKYLRLAMAYAMPRTKAVNSARLKFGLTPEQEQLVGDAVTGPVDHAKIARGVTTLLKKLSTNMTRETAEFETQTYLGLSVENMQRVKDAVFSGIKDLSGKADMLAELFELQAAFSKRIGVSPTGDDQDDGIKLNDLVTATLDELCEVRNTTYWKHWYKEARDGRQFFLHDRARAKKEVVDMLFFWICLAQVVGLTAEEAFEQYRKKSALNHRRQDDDCTTEQAHNNYQE